MAIDQDTRPEAPAAPEDSAVSLIAAIAEAVDEQRRVEARQFLHAAQWADLHPVESIDDAATEPYADEELAVAGPGAPLVAAWCVAELAAALGMSTGAGHRYLGDAVETRHRLPRLWSLAMAGTVPVWKVRKVAQLTVILSRDAAAEVDRELARRLRSCSIAHIQRTVEKVLAEHHPAQAEERRRAAAEQRRLEVDLRHLDTTDGVAHVFGTLDLGDAFDLDHALALGAAQLAAAGSTDSLRVRRAKAAGMLARGELDLGRLSDPALDPPAAPAADSGAAAEPEAEPEPEPGGPPPRTKPGRGRAPGRQVVVYTHLHATGTGPSEPGGSCFGPVADVDNAHAHVLVEQIQEWCGDAGARIVVKPVIDLAEHLRTASYAPTRRLREQVELIHPECVFPHCHRPSSTCDLDHLVPWSEGGTTCSCNLVPLCRRHHRLKTHAGWRVSRIGPRDFRWTSPLGRTYRRHPR